MLLLQRGSFESIVTHYTNSPQPGSLSALGWSDYFSGQLRPDETELVPGRIAAIHRERLTGMTEAGSMELLLPVAANTGQFAVGDWVLVHQSSQTLCRRLSRRTVLERRSENSRTPQLGAANLDTLFIVTSCNSEFNVARLERYLVLANQGGIDPVILLTKADLTNDAGSYQRRAAAIQRGLAGRDRRPPQFDRIRGFGPLVRLWTDRGAGRVLRCRQIVAGQQAD